MLMSSVALFSPASRLADERVASAVRGIYTDDRSSKGAIR